MKQINKALSLLVVLLMLAGASITVNKSIFGQKIPSSQEEEIQSGLSSDTISVSPDGSIVIHTSGLKGTINGYAGPVPVDIHLKDGKITGVEALANVETPSFFKRAQAVLDSWTGNTPENAVDMKVDGVTGATYSSGAIINNVRVGLDYYLGVQSSSAPATPLKIWIAFAVTLAACIMPLFVKNKVYHNVQLLANVVVLGFWCGQFLDYMLILKYMSSGIALPAGIVAAVMLIAAFIFPLFGHPQHYCNNICPLGSAQLLVAQLCSYKIHLSVRVLKGLDWFRKILWAVLMLLLWADCFTSWMDLELFQSFQFRSASWWIVGAACVFVGLSAVVSRPYCRFICPTGSLFKRSENIG